MTDARNQAITPRTDAPFTFYLNGTRFFPGAGTTLRFAANATDVLEMPSLPPGMVDPGDEIVVKYLGTTVFRGEVAKAVRRKGRGVDDVESVSVEGPWGKLSRMPYLQTWKVANENVPGGVAEAQSSRVILNRSYAGLEISMTQQITDVADFAIGHGMNADLAKGTIAAGSQILPADETRDITCAAAILRTLRFFPRTVCRFDYSGQKPALNVATPGTTDAAWLSTAKILGREYERTAHPVVGVVIHTMDVEYSAANGAMRTVSGQSAGVIDSIDTLHVTMPLAPPENSRQWEKIEVEVESASDVSNILWWWQKHPRLKGVAWANIKSYGPAERSSNTYANITNTTIGDLERFGFHGEVVRWTMPVTLDTGDEVDEQVLLSFDYVTTDCNGGTYKRTTASSATAGETLPDGLAAAILAQRAGALMGETVTIRLGSTLPVIGDVADELVLQEDTVDCYELTAQCKFGRPAYLAPEDMRDLLNGFRGRGFVAVTERNNADPAPDDADDIGGVQPLDASDWAPGTKAKTTIKSVSAGANGGAVVMDATSQTGGAKAAVSDSSGDKSIKLDTDDIPQECEHKDGYAIHELKYKAVDGNEHTVHGLFCRDVDLTEIVGAGKTIKDVSAEPYGTGGTKITFTWLDDTTTEIVISGGGGGGGQQGPPGEDGETPEITSNTVGDTTYIYADGAQIAAIQNGRTPQITATKENGITTICADNVPIATIEDGEDGVANWDTVDVVTGISFAVEDGKLKALLDKATIYVPDTFEMHPVETQGAETVEVCNVEELDVVVSEAYSSSAHQFTNTRKRIKVLGSADAVGQTPFTATALADEV